MNTISEICALISNDSRLSSLRDRVEPIISVEPGHDIGHVLRVGLWTIRIGGNKIVPREAIASALCHDIVNVPKNSPRRSEASLLSAKVACQLLPQYDFSPASVKLISNAIRDHSFSRGAKPSTALGQALQDADRLDALGTIGIIRTFSINAAMGKKYFDILDPWAATRELDEGSFAIDHFFTKLLTLSETMCTEIGRAEAIRRIGIMENFLDSLADDITEPRSGNVHIQYKVAAPHNR